MLVKPHTIICTFLQEGYSEETIADWLGVNRATINRYKNVKLVPSLGSYERMIKVYNSDRKEFEVAVKRTAKRWAKRDVMAGELPLKVVQRMIDKKWHTVVADCNGKVIARR